MTESSSTIYEARFERFDYIIAMDQSNLQVLQSSSEEQRQKKVYVSTIEEGMNSQSDVQILTMVAPLVLTLFWIYVKGCDGLIEFLKLTFNL